MRVVKKNAIRIARVFVFTQTEIPEVFLRALVHPHNTEMFA
jgi:hypothetical protein